MECCSDPGQKGSTNDHSVRDERLQLPWVGCLEYGMTGYRFIRIDNCDEVGISLVQVFGVSVHSGKKYRGAFACNDEIINRVWEASAYTLYLNNNKYITDGIKRDRLVWIGDMHPETVSVLRLFGNDPSIRRSLDYIRDITELPAWMNDIPSYSMWWCKIQRDLYWYTGDSGYLAKQLPYIGELCGQLLGCVKPDGTYDVGYKFIDWPSSDQPAAQDLGIRSLLSLSLRSCLEIFHVFGDASRDGAIGAALKSLSAKPLERVGNKQAVALAVFAGLLSAEQAEREVFSKEPLRGLSTFLGYYVMQARAKAGVMRARWISYADITVPCSIWARRRCGRISICNGRRAQSRSMHCSAKGNTTYTATTEGIAIKDTATAFATVGRREPFPLPVNIYWGSE